MSACCKRLCLFALTMLLTAVNLLSQEISHTYLTKTDWLNKNDLKKWESAILKISQADEAMTQSNESYLQMSAMEGNAELDEKKKQKDLPKIEKSAIENYSKALELYKTTYTALYDIVKSYIGDPQKQHPAYHEMIFSADQAESLYAQNNDADTDEQREQISKANEYLLLAIENGITILTVGAETYNQQTTVNNAQSISVSDIQINNDLYEMYKSYTEDPTIADPLTANSLLNLDNGSASFDTYLQQWVDYVNGVTPEKPQLAGFEQEIEDTLVAMGILESEENLADLTHEDTKIGSSGNELSLSADKTGSTYESGVLEPKPGSTARNFARELFESPDVDISDLNEFRIQIAASKTPLSMAQIRSIYVGSKSVVEIKEGGLFKYQIRGFQLPVDAQKECSLTGIDNAYIEAYQHGERKNLAQAVNEARPLADQVQKVGRQRALNEIYFTVQVAASRIRLANDQVAEIYQGNLPVSLVCEEGWYKYQIFIGSDLQKAMNTVDECGVNKAFLVAYKNGEKLELYKALQEYKSNTP